MGRTIISKDGRFEWDENKDRLNKKDHGFSFEEILEVFDDPAFLEGYVCMRRVHTRGMYPETNTLPKQPTLGLVVSEHSEKEDRYYGIGCLNNILYVIAFYTIRGERKRIISARRADNDEQEVYNDYFKKVKS
jgi:uncharacterized DUF497 family protein